MRDVVILGSSGLAKEMLWLLEENRSSGESWNILGFIDSPINKEPLPGYGIIGDDEWLWNYSHPICAVCGLGNAMLRRRVIEKYRNFGSSVTFPTVISSASHVSQYAKLGEGCIVCAGSMVSPGVNLGSFVLLNLNCTVGHDSVIQDFTTVNPGSNISGNVLIGKTSEIGTGTHIIQGKHLGPRTITGAGSVIINNIAGNCTVVGVPARILEEKNK